MLDYRVGNARPQNFFSLTNQPLGLRLDYEKSMHSVQIPISSSLPIAAAMYTVVGQPTELFIAAAHAV